MVRGLKGVRHFICKRCEKPSTDEHGGFSRYDKKHNAELIYENVDLCRKCFKLTRKDQSNFNRIKILFEKHILNENNIKQFQTDRQFKFMIHKKYFVAKKGDLKKINESYIDDLKRSQKLDRDFKVLFN